VSYVEEPNKQKDSNLLNDSILLELAKKVSEECQKFIYDFRESENKPVTYTDSFIPSLKHVKRPPNQKEVNVFFCRKLVTDLLIWGIITTEQYRSAKGEIRKGHYENVFKFLQRISGGDEVISKVLKYKDSTLDLYEGTVPVKLPETVKFATIELTADELKNRINKKYAERVQNEEKTVPEPIKFGMMDITVDNDGKFKVHRRETQDE